MTQQPNSSEPDDQPDSDSRWLAELRERNDAIISRLRISTAALKADVQLLQDQMFAALSDPAMAGKARAIFEETIQARRQDGMIQRENLFGPKIAAWLNSQPGPEADGGE